MRNNQNTNISNIINAKQESLARAGWVSDDSYIKGKLYTICKSALAEYDHIDKAPYDKWLEIALEYDAYMTEQNEDYSFVLDILALYGVELKYTHFCSYAYETTSTNVAFPSLLNQNMELLHDFLKLAKSNTFVRDWDEGGDWRSTTYLAPKGLVPLLENILNSKKEKSAPDTVTEDPFDGIMATPNNDDELPF